MKKVKADKDQEDADILEAAQDSSMVNEEGLEQFQNNEAAEEYQVTDHTPKAKKVISE